MGNTSAPKNVIDKYEEIKQLLKSYEEPENSPETLLLIGIYHPVHYHQKAPHFPHTDQEFPGKGNDKILQEKLNNTKFKANLNRAKKTVISSKPDDLLHEPKLNGFTSSTTEEIEYESQQIDNVTIGLVVGISIVVFLIIVINCFTFRIYLKEHKDDDRSFQSDISESSSSGTRSRTHAGCSPNFAYHFYDDSM